MSDTVTIPAHIENGSVHLDGPLPLNVERVEVRVTVPTAQQQNVASLIRFLESLPPGTRSREEIDAEIREGRGDEDR